MPHDQENVVEDAEVSEAVNDEDQKADAAESKPEGEGEQEAGVEDTGNEAESDAVIDGDDRDLPF